MVSFPLGSISGTINGSVYINCCGNKGPDLTSSPTPTPTPTPTPIPSCDWDGNGKLKFTSTGCNVELLNVPYIKSGNSWTASLALKCAPNSVSMTISCNPNVILTSFNPTTCAQKWTATSSMSCSSATLVGNDGNCTNDIPPWFTFYSDLVGCPGNCCPGCGGSGVYTSCAQICDDPNAVDINCYQHENGYGVCGQDCTYGEPCNNTPQSIVLMDGSIVDCYCCL